MLTIGPLPDDDVIDDDVIDDDASESNWIIEDEEEVKGNATSENDLVTEVLEEEEVSGTDLQSEPGDLVANDTEIGAVTVQADSGDCGCCRRRRCRRRGCCRRRCNQCGAGPCTCGGNNGQEIVPVPVVLPGNIGQSIVPIAAAPVAVAPVPVGAVPAQSPVLVAPAPAPVVVAQAPVAQVPLLSG